MNSIDIMKILNELDEVCVGKTADYFADMFSVSVPTIKNVLKNYNDVLPKLAGMKILGKSGRGNGYFLEINNPSLYEEFLRTGTEKKELDFSQQTDRVKYIAEQLVITGDYIKAEDFVEKLCLSKSQFSRDLLLARRNIESYDIEIIDKPYYGLKIQGTEFNIRRFLANQFNYVEQMFNIRDFDDSEMDKAMKDLREILVMKSSHYDYNLSDITCKNLVIHLMVAISRIDENLEISIDEKMIESLRSEEEFPLAVAIVEMVQKQFNVHFNDDEVYYIVMHLSSKKIIKDDNFVVGEAVQKLVDKILKEIKNDFDIDLRGDFNLRIMLALHIVPLLSRIKYNTVLANPLLDQIKENLWVAYEFALSASRVINREYNCNLSEEETAYFALHLRVALNEVQEKKKKRILLVCATGKGSAELLKSNFSRKFSEYIEALYTCDVLELDDLDLTQFDCIFSAVPITKQVSIPIFKVTYFIDAVTEGDIKNLLQKDNNSMKVIKFFEGTKFFTGISGTNRNEVIAEIMKRVRVTEDLPDDFEKEVYERERLSSTDFGNGIAFPHPNRHMSDMSFISITVLNKPILWEKNKVQLVILCNFEKGFVRTHGDVMHVITEIITNKAIVQKIIDTPTYENYLSVIKEMS